MVQIHNTTLFKELREGTKVQQLRDTIPSQLAEKVVPVMEVNPKLLRRCNIVKRNTNLDSLNATVYTTPAAQDFYLVGATLSLIKDAGSASTATTLTVVIDGVTVAIFYIPSITLTAQQDSMTISLPIPLKLDRGSIINIANTSGAAIIRAGASIIGYTVENPLA